VRTAAQCSRGGTSRRGPPTPTTVGETPATCSTRCRRGDRAMASHEQGDAVRVRGGGVGGILLASPRFLRPLLAAAWLAVPTYRSAVSCRPVSGRAGGKRGHEDATRRGRVVPHALAAGRGMEGAILPGAGLPVALLFADGATHREFCFTREKIKQGTRRKRRRMENPPAACWGEWNQLISCVSFWLEWGPSSPAPGHGFLHPEPAARNLTPVSRRGACPRFVARLPSQEGTRSEPLPAAGRVYQLSAPILRPATSLCTSPWRGDAESPVLGVSAPSRGFPVCSRLHPTTAPSPQGVWGRASAGPQLSAEALGSGWKMPEEGTP